MASNNAARRRLGLGLCAVLVAATAVAARPPTAYAAASDAYTWGNVAVHGGGFVDGIVYNKSQANLVYARTDIGGAYRWNATAGRWVPLQDFTAPGDWNLLGVDSLATDPVDPHRLVMLVGEYTQSWAGNAAVLRSTDQGATFARTDLPFKTGGNENGRSMGERLMIDPNRDAVVYMGTRNNGLWRSTDYGATWAQVTSFTATGQAGLGVAWIEFDKASGTAGAATPTIYAGVADTTTPIWVSRDAGATWAPLAGQPAAGMPHHGRLAGDGTLYVTYGDSPGPYTMNNGAVWKRSAAGAWTNITPLVPYTNGESGFGYAGLAVDAQHPQTVMVATMGRWGPVDDIFRSTNGGTTWVSVTAHKTMDVSAAPYLAWHGTPKLGWMIGSLEIDPFNADKFLYGTGATVYGTDTATALDRGGSVTISSRAFGLEETAVEDLVSPPSGPPLISALGDIGVFRHDDITVVPPGGMAANPVFGTASSLDFAQAAPSVVYRAGSATAPDPGLAYSLDGGATWSPVASVPENPEGAGNVAVSADGNTVVWSPSQRGVFRSTNRGATWTAATGVPGTTVAVRADRVNPAVFYAFVNGTFYVSTNGGASFAAAATGLPTGSTYFKPVPGAAGDVWLTTGYGGLYRSTNSGSSFAHLGNVTEAYTVGFGKAAPGQTYPAVYLNGIVDGVNGLFRSDNAGTTWVRINDDAHQWGWIGQTITGDPRVYGRVYVSTNGRGIVYGDRAGTSVPPDTTPPSTPGTPTAAGVTASGASLSWAASTDNTAVTGYDVLNAAGAVLASSATNSVTLTGLAASTQYALRVRARDAAGNLSAASGTVTFTTAAPPGGACAVTYTVTNSWSGAFQVDVSVRNTGSTPVNGWTLAWSYANGQAVYNMWNGAYTQSGVNVTVTNLSYNATIAAGGGTQGFGFQATWNNSANAKPASFTLNGAACTSG